MTNRTIENSPQIYARIGGVFYLIIIIVGIFGEAFVRNRLIVWGDPTATAEKIRSAEFLWRVGIAGELFMLIGAVALALIFYLLLRPVHKDLALLVAFFNLVSISLEASNKMQLLATLFPLAKSDYLSVLDPEQLHLLAYLTIRSHAYGFGVSLIFFGGVCLVLGHLIIKSGYLPKVLGIMMQIAGLCYLTNSFAMILSPSLANMLFPVILIPAFIGELSLCLWLLVKGVDVSKWEARVSAKA